MVGLIDLVRNTLSIERVSRNRRVLGIYSCRKVVESLLVILVLSTVFSVETLLL